MSCICCNKPLKRRESIQRGMGPVCYARKMAKIESEAEEFTDKVDLPFDSETMDIVCQKEVIPNNEPFSPLGPTWRNHFNIFQIYKHHSPTGMNWGYGGSGPADFAMNILELFFRAAGEKPTSKITCYDDGETYKMPICEWTLVLYQDFKRDIVCALPEEGGTIKGDEVRAWIEKAKVENEHHWRLAA